MIDVKVNSIAVTFKVDTGPEVTAISEDTLLTLGQLEVSKPDKKPKQRLKKRFQRVPIGPGKFLERGVDALLEIT